jgi:hypothetical protein
MTESNATTPTDSILDLLSDWEAASDDDLERLMTEFVGVDRLSSLGSLVSYAQFDDWTEVAPTLLDLVAQQKGVDPWDLDPQLNTVIDTDSLEALFVGSGPGDVDGGCLLTFPFHEYTVKVASDGVISLHESGV